MTSSAASVAGSSAPRPSRRPRRRRGRVFLIGGIATTAVAAASVLLLQSRPAPYTPGAEAATSSEITRTLNRTLPAGVPDIRFKDAAGEAGIRFTHFSGQRSTQLPEDMGSGAAWGDYDNDGDSDLFIVNESGPLTLSAADLARSAARSALYRNDGAGHFTDVTDASRIEARGNGMAAAWGDYDGDGFLDLVETRFGTSLLFHNNGDSTFADVSQPMGISKETGFWSGASWADYDRDGDLDLYVCGYVQYRYDAEVARKKSLQYRAMVPFTLNPSTFTPERNLLFRNDRGHFTEVAVKAGVVNTTGRSLSASWCDFDQDGWPDLYVANDISDNAMYRNNGNGTFSDVSHSSWVADYRGAMGLAVGDWDNDDDFDMYITHWIAQENAFYDNQKGTLKTSPTDPMHFVDRADQLGLGQSTLDYVGWGTGFLDFDNDTHLDILSVNGSTFQRTDDESLLTPMKNQLFWNSGSPKGFYEVGESYADAFAVENVGRGAAIADYDNDGDEDAIVVVNGGPARLLRNDGGNGRRWLRVIVRGPAGLDVRPARTPATTSFATSAIVRISAGGVKQIRQIGAESSYLSQSPPGETHFGLGDASRIDRLEITWPDGVKQVFENLPANSVILVREGAMPEVETSPGPEAG